MTFLKPLSAAIAIGTGGPFGAEGPIIATGGALGSLLGQVLHVTADERKTLLAAGAAAGMAATFGSPVSAVLLAVELLLFEYRPRSLIPVALAAAAATGVRMRVRRRRRRCSRCPTLAQPGGAALAAYIAHRRARRRGCRCCVTRARLRGRGRVRAAARSTGCGGRRSAAVAVGVVGYFAPRTLGVGYDNIEAIARRHARRAGAARPLRA